MPARDRWSRRIRNAGSTKALPSLSSLVVASTAVTGVALSQSPTVEVAAEATPPPALSTWDNPRLAPDRAALGGSVAEDAVRQRPRPAAPTPDVDREEDAGASRTSRDGSRPENPPENPHGKAHEKARAKHAAKHAAERDHGRDHGKGRHRRGKHEREWLSPAEIAHAIGGSPRQVAQTWPVIEKALQKEGMDEVHTRIAVLATMVTEVGPSLRPINEYGGPSYFTRMYEGRSDLGNNRPGDGARFHGRGYIQLTGRANYRSYGAKLGVPLEKRPGMALRPKVGAQVLAQYFKERGIDHDARQGDWVDTRVKVNGGLNGWSTYRGIVSSLWEATREAHPHGS